MAEFRPEEENVIYVGDGATVTGSLAAEGVVVIDGKIEGEVTCGHIIIGPSGAIDGKITVTSADIYGEVGADISIKQLMIVRASGRVQGSWICGEIEVERGGILTGDARSSKL